MRSGYAWATPAQFPALVSDSRVGAAETGNQKLALLVRGQREIHRDLGFHLDRLIVQNVRLVAPLAHRVNRRTCKHRMTGQNSEFLNRSLLADHRLQQHGSLNSRTSCQRRIRWLNFVKQASFADVREAERMGINSWRRGYWQHRLRTAGK